MSKLRIGVIGIGYWGKKVLYEYHQLAKIRDDVELSAVCDINEERLREARNLYNIPVAMGNYKELLNEDCVDAVHICTPNETHYDICNEALAAGKHVLVEKPMTLKAREAFKLARLAEREGLVLLVGHIFRFNNAVKEARRLLESNSIGDVYCLEFRWTTLIPPIPERDIVFDLAPHPIDILNYLTDEWPTEVCCKARSFVRGERGLEEAAFIIQDMPDGELVSMMLSWVHPGEKERVVFVTGSDGQIRLDALSQRLSIIKENRIYEVPIEPNNTILEEINTFADCILNDNPLPSSGLIGAMTVMVLEALRRSIEERRSVPIMRG